MIFALYFGGFGATLLADPSMYFAGGALPYWTTPLDNEAGDIQNRMFGAQLLGIGIIAFLHGGEALVKMLVALGNQSRVLVVRRADKQIFAQFDSDFLR